MSMEIHFKIMAVAGAVGTMINRSAATRGRMTEAEIIVVAARSLQDLADNWENWRSDRSAILAGHVNRHLPPGMLMSDAVLTREIDTALGLHDLHFHMGLEAILRGDDARTSWQKQIDGVTE